MAIASASPPAATSLPGTTTPMIPASPKPSYSSLSAITHKSKNIIFSEAKRGRKTPTATTGSKRNYGSFSHLAEINKERKKNSVSLLTLAEALYLSHSWLKTRKRRKKRLCFSLCFAEISVTLSTLVEVGVTLSPLVENKKKKKKKRLFLSTLFSLFFSLSKNKRSNQGKPFTGKRESCK